MFKRSIATLCLLAIVSLPASGAGMRGAPELKNRREIVDLLLAGNAGALIRQGVSASVQLMVEVDEKGRVTKSHLTKPSGYGVLDSALVSLAKRMSFVPGTDDGRPVKVWVTVPFAFGAGEIK